MGGYVSLWLFGLSFAFVEASVVVYLRQITGIEGSSLFPIRLESPPELARVFEVERYREAATLLLMLTPALLYGKGLFERIVVYGIVFGIWDAGYYMFLWWLTGWPESPLTYDVLFLLPTLWVAPVLCPALVSLALILFGTAYLWLLRRRMERLPNPLQWLMAVAGGVLVLAAFVQHDEYYLAGGMPPMFTWWLFLLGYVMAVSGGAWFLVEIARQPRTRFV